jgi:hypothetical protein
MKLSLGLRINSRLTLPYKGVAGERYVLDRAEQRRVEI